MKPSSGIEKILVVLHTAPKHYNGTSLNYQHMEFRGTAITFIGVKKPLEKNKRMYFSEKVILQFLIACLSLPSITKPLKETSPALIFDVFDHGLSTAPYANKKRTANTIQKIITLANPYQELMNMRKRPLIAFLNLQSANKILKAQIGVIRKLKVLSPCSQMFFSIAGELKRNGCNFGNKTDFNQNHHGLFAHNQAVPIEVYHSKRRIQAK